MTNSLTDLMLIARAGDVMMQQEEARRRAQRTIPIATPDAGPSRSAMLGLPLPSMDAGPSRAAMFAAMASQPQESGPDEELPSPEVLAQMFAPGSAMTATERMIEEEKEAHRQRIAHTDSTPDIQERMAAHAAPRFKGYDQRGMMPFDSREVDSPQIASHNLRNALPNLRFPHVAQQPSLAAALAPSMDELEADAAAMEGVEKRKGIGVPGMISFGANPSSSRPLDQELASPARRADPDYKSYVAAMRNQGNAIAAGVDDDDLPQLPAMVGNPSKQMMPMWELAKLNPEGLDEDQRARLSRWQAWQDRRADDREQANIARMNRAQFRGLVRSGVPPQAVSILQMLGQGQEPSPMQLAMMGRPDLARIASASASSDRELGLKERAVAVEEAQQRMQEQLFTGPVSEREKVRAGWSADEIRADQKQRQQSELESAARAAPLPAPGQMDIAAIREAQAGVPGSRHPIYGRMPAATIRLHFQEIYNATGGDPNQFLARVPISAIKGDPQGFANYFRATFGENALQESLDQDVWFDVGLGRRKREVSRALGMQPRSYSLFSSWADPDYWADFAD